MEFSWQRAARLGAPRPTLSFGVCIGALFLALVFFNLINSILPTADDVTLYFDYSRRTLSGEIPFLDFKIEYPPFAVVFFMVPALLSYPLGGLNRDLYACLFHTQCFVLEAATLWLAYCLLQKIYPGARPAIFRPRLIWYTLGALAISLYLFQRFDIGVTFLLSLALYWLYDRKPGRAGVVLALGASAKLYPAIVLPFALFYFWRYQGDRRSAIRCFTGFCIAGSLTNLPFLILNPTGLLGFVKFHIDRGLEIETIFATLGVVGHYLNLAPAISINDHNSLGITSQWTHTLVVVSTLITLTGLLILFWLGWRATKPGNQLRADWLIQASAVGVLWFILANKVLSPQYLIWMLSFVPFWKGSKQPIYAAALLLSILPFPFLIDGLLLLDWFPMSLLVIRNGLLVAVFLQLIPSLQALDLKVKKVPSLAQAAWLTLPEKGIE